MKKVFTFALGLTMLASVSTAMAKVTTVTTKAEFITAWNSTGNTNESCDTILVQGNINTGNVSADAAPQAGKVVIMGVNDEESGARAVLATGLNFRNNDAACRFSLRVENLNFQDRSGATAGSGQILYFQNKTFYMDSLVLHNCEITNFVRAILRSIPPAVKDANNNTIYCDGGTVGYVEMSNCLVHYGCVTNSMPLLYFGQAVYEIVVKNNTFYDMPLMKNIVGFNYINKDSTNVEDCNVLIENNSVFVGNNKTEALFSFGGYLGQMSTYNIKNNLLLYPNWTNDYTLEQTVDSRIFDARYGMVYANNNVISGYNYWASGNKAVNATEDPEEGKWIDCDTTGNYTMADVELEWTDFAAADANDFTIFRGSKLYTAGVDGAPIGDTRWYSDVAKVKAAFSAVVAGSKSAAITISPEKGQYFVGDVITLTLDTKGTLNTFLGWSDGSTELERVITLEGDLALTANFKELPYVAVWDFSSTVKNAVAPQAADYASVEGATLNFKTWKDESYVDSIGNISFRNNKFAEDSIIYGLQIKSDFASLEPVILGHANFVYIALPTTGYKDLTVKAYVGTDNTTSVRQLCEYSLDGATWTSAGSVDLTTSRAWAMFDVTLPEACNNQDMLYIRFISDPTSELLVDEAILAGDVDYSNEFTYIGTIYVLSNSALSIESIGSDAIAADKNAPVYDLMGRKVVRMDAGHLYIQGGKKFIQK